MKLKRHFLSASLVLAGLVLGTALTLSAQTWQSLGPQSGNATALVRDPQNRLTIYAILSPGGVYKSLDGGVSWAFAGTGIPSTAAIGGLAVDPAQTSILYAAAGSLYKSTDSGAHWAALASQPFGTPRRIFVSPFDSSTLLIGTEWSVQRSLDAGATWSGALLAGQIADAVFDPLHPGTIYVAIKGGVLAKSTDNGATWASVPSSVTAVDLAFDPGSRSVLYAVVPAVGIFRTDDGGATWTVWNAEMDLDPPGYITNYLTCFAPGPAGSGYYYAGTERGLYRSHDNGASYWGFQTTAPEYPVTNAVLVDPTNKEIVLAATSLGIYRSIVAGTQYYRSSDGIDTVSTDAIALAISPANPARIMLGTSLGLYRSDGRGGSWSFAAFSHYTNHVVRTVAAHPTDASVFAAGTDFGLFRSPDGGSNYYLSYPKPNPTDIRISSLVFDPFQPAKAYAGASMAWPGFYVSSDGGATWSFNNPPQGLSIRSLAADPSQEGVLYAGLDGGWPAIEGPPGYYLAKSTDRGATWTGMARTIISRRVNSFFADPSAPALFYVAGEQGFYKSEDGGATWRRITGNLGSGEVRYLAVDPQSPHYLYASAANTVFRSTDHGETWAAFGTGLPADSYVVLAVDPSDSSIVYAGSGGKGGLFRTGGGDVPQLRVDTDVLNFGVIGGAGATPSQKVRIFNGGTGTLHWTASVYDSDAPFVHVSPAGGTGDGSISVTVDPAGVPAGGRNVTVQIIDPAAQGSPKNIRVQIKRYNSGPYGSPQPPFGQFDTPLDGATVRSSIAVSGWALDDIEVMGVKIYRDPVNGEPGGRKYIGDATFVEGARPDVETIYHDYPFQRRAGWGYMLLTNFLPNNGNGTFALRAVATDKEGNEVELGSRVITCDNAHAVLPFGAIDTPEQGGQIAGSGYFNFGWALTPMPNSIPTDGSTIGVWIDGVFIGHPAYNNYRDDIAT
ncbi:MAG: Ig-like domain-containing protein, partial [Candidatus Aminicenantes bacterium]|nr:Ig-like domain-containing protein [Candidatus Aminicenantes bacterium]